jgi:phage shock protein A
MRGMGIFSRLNSVLQSNINSAIDKAEDPEKLIAQTVLEMEEGVKAARKDIVVQLGTAKRLDKKRDELLNDARGWEEKAVLALRQGDDDLAREALKRKQKAEREAGEVEKQAAAAAAAVDEMKDTLEKVERKIDEIKARKTSLASSVRRSREGTGAAIAGSGLGGSFDDLARMTGRIEQLEAEVEAHDVLDDGGKSLEVDAAFRKLEKEQRGGAVEDELSALKKKLEGK